MENLKIYDKGVREKFPNNRIGKHISVDLLNEAINEYVETGEHHLGVELIRFYNWNVSLHKEMIRIISEENSRFQCYDAYLQTEKELDFNVIQKVTWDKLKVDLLNKLYFVFQSQEAITYSELRNLLSVMDLT